MNNILRNKWFIFFILFIFCGCKKIDYNNNVSREKLNLIIYLAGDTEDLRAEVSPKLESIKKGWKKDFNGSGYILVDSSELTNPSLLTVEFLGENKKFRKIKEYNNRNTADPDLFGTVLKDVKAHSVFNTKYGLIVFSHGTGWIQEDNSPQGFLFNNVKKNKLNIVKTYSVVSDGDSFMGINDFAKHIPDSFFEFIIFENCYMGGIEILAELKNKTKVVGGSSAEVLAPGFTDIYPKILSILFSNKEDRYLSVGKEYFSYWNAKKGDYRSATFSFLNVSEVDKLINWARVHLKDTILLNTNHIQHFDRYNPHIFFDLQETFELFSSDDSHEDLMNILNKMILYKKATDDFLPNHSGFKINNFSGMTTFIQQTSTPSLNIKYRETLWYKLLQ